MEIKKVRLNNLLRLASKYSTINEFCKLIGMEPSYFSQIKGFRKSIGDSWARKIEEKLGFEYGYFDTQIPEPVPAVEQVTDAGAMAIAYAIESLPLPIRHQLKCFVYQIASEISVKSH